MKYKMCVWDLDGTLLNTLPSLHYYNNKSLEHYGFKKITYKDSIDLIKYPLGQYYQNLLILGGCPVDKVDEIVDELTEYDYTMYNDNPLYLVEEFPDIKETLIQLNELGIVNAVFSNKFEEICIKTVNHFYPSLIKYVSGQLIDSPPKPNVGCLDRLNKQSDISLDEMLLIGDTQVDILTARNNNTKVAAVSWGYQDLDVLNEYKPDYIIHNPKEVLDIIKGDK